MLFCNISEILFVFVWSKIIPFILQVYGLLSLQLTMTTLIAAVCMATPQIKEGVQSHPGFLLAAFVSSFAILIALFVKRRESPINLILLAAFVSTIHQNCAKYWIEMISGKSHIKFFPNQGTLFCILDYCWVLYHRSPCLFLRRSSCLASLLFDGWCCCRPHSLCVSNKKRFHSLGYRVGWSLRFQV